MNGELIFSTSTDTCIISYRSYNILGHILLETVDIWNAEPGIIIFLPCYIKIKLNFMNLLVLCPLSTSQDISTLCELFGIKSISLHLHVSPKSSTSSVSPPPFYLTSFLTCWSQLDIGPVGHFPLSFMFKNFFQIVFLFLKMQPFHLNVLCITLTCLSLNSL
jgi:hypothetical protein